MKEDLRLHSWLIGRVKEEKDSMKQCLNSDIYSFSNYFLFPYVSLYLKTRVTASVLPHVVFQELRDDRSPRERHYGILVWVRSLQQLSQNVRLLAVTVGCPVVVTDQRAVVVLIGAVGLVHSVDQGVSGAGEYRATHSPFHPDVNTSALGLSC